MKEKKKTLKSNLIAVTITQDVERNCQENLHVPRLGSLHIRLSFLGQRVPLEQRTSQ